MFAEEAKPIDVSTRQVLAIGLAGLLTLGTQVQIVPFADKRLVVVGYGTEACPSNFGPIVGATSQAPSVSTAEQIRLVRDVTGLTWDQFAKVFGVSRRAVHSWATGARMNSTNVELLQRLIQDVGTLQGHSVDDRRAEFLLGRDGDRSMYAAYRAMHVSSPGDINRDSREDA